MVSAPGSALPPQPAEGKEPQLTLTLTLTLTQNWACGDAVTGAWLSVGA